MATIRRRVEQVETEHEATVFCITVTKMLQGKLATSDKYIATCSSL